MESYSKLIGELLKLNGATLSTAESCTGGNVAHLITLVPGASEYFKGAVVSYATCIKETLLNVPHSIISEHGVVSGEVAEAMAKGVREICGSTYSVSTTGLAGPGGDGRDPEGTVWVGVSGPSGEKSRKFNFKGDRISNIDAFSEAALKMLFDFINSAIKD